MSETEIDEVLVETAARALATELMSRDMQKAPRVTQRLYVDAIWREYIGAARVMVKLFKG